MVMVFVIALGLAVLAYLVLELLRDRSNRVSWAGWLQLAALVVAVLVTTRLLGPYLARVLDGGPARGDRVFLPVERLVYRIVGVDPAREQPWTIYALSLLAFSGVSVLGLFLLQRLQGVLLPQSDRCRRRPAGARVQHRGELRHEHELAELRRRVDDEPPHADVGARRPELRLGGGRDRRRGRAHPRA